jgi:hypothetical protein
MMAAGAAQSQAAPAAPPDRPCESNPAYKRLDFWVGRWEVFVKDKKVGDNLIEKTLSGCAVIENWKNMRSREGKSLFYYEPAAKQWKQVWVTDSGPMKEKAEVKEFPGPGVRFQGVVTLEDDTTKVLDRTTLTPLEKGRVRQVIEESHDGGKTWEVTFDAIYVRAP